MRLGIRNKILLGYSTLLGLTVVLILVVLFNLNSLLSNFNFLIDHDQPVLTGTADLIGHVVDMETGMRGFLVTGNEDFLEPLNLALFGTAVVDSNRALELAPEGLFLQQFDELLELVSDNPDQQEQLREVRNKVKAWIDDVAVPFIADRREVRDATGTFDVLALELSEGRGKEIIDELRSVVDEIVADIEVSSSDPAYQVSLEEQIQLLAFLNLIVDMETGQRGFLMTGNDIFLEPFDSSRLLLTPQIASLNNLFRGDTNNLSRITRLEELSNLWLVEVADAEILSRRNIDGDQATFGDLITSVDSQIGKDHVDDIRAELTLFQDEEIRLNNIRNEDTQNLATTIQIIILVVGVVSILLGLAVSFFIGNLLNRDINILVEATERMAAGNRDVHVEIATQDEIGELATSFNGMVEELNTAYEEVEASAKDMQTVVDVSNQIATILDVGRLLQDVADLTKERFGLYHSHIYILDNEGQILTLTAGAGHVGRQMVAELRTIEFSNRQSVVATAARERHSVVFNDVASSPTFLAHPLLPNTKSEAAIPLVARGTVLGVLDVQGDTADYFTEDSVNVLEILSNQIATALSNAALFESSDRISRHEQALGSIDRQIQQAVDVDEVLQIAVRELGKALRVPHTAIELSMRENYDGDNGAE